jgi:hypothetical protein
MKKREGNGRHILLHHHSFFHGMKVPRKEFLDHNRTGKNFFVLTACTLFAPLAPSHYPRQPQTTIHPKSKH